jgi:hypothetical protein
MLRRQKARQDQQPGEGACREPAVGGGSPVPLICREPLETETAATRPGCAFRGELPRSA